MRPERYCRSTVARRDRSCRFSGSARSGHWRPGIAGPPRSLPPTRPSAAGTRASRMEGLTSADLEDLRKAMLLGTARRPLTPPPALAALIEGAPAAADPALLLLALVGQVRRFERPSTAPP